MIYTVTLNPAIDYVMEFDSIKEGLVNRGKREEIFIGGKGINVSIVLNELSVDSTALGFIAGFTGDLIKKELNSLNIKTDFTQLKNGFTRINVKLKSQNETDLNAMGPSIDSDEEKAFLDKLNNLKNGDMLVLSGSVPKTLSQDFYEKIILHLKEKQIDFAIDAEGDLLLKTIKYNPFLIKPNNHELGELFGVEINDFETARIYAEKLKNMGAENVLVSMAEKGALLVCKDGSVKTISAAKGRTVNSVGAGDSMVAGFIAGYKKTNDYGFALKLSVAAGGATAFSQGLATKEEIEKLLENI